MIYKNRLKLATDIASFFPDSWTPDAVADFLEKPKQSKLGHISLPVFRLSKELKKAPPVLASEKAEEITNAGLAYIAKVESASGFINFFWTTDFLLETLKEVITPEKFGQGKTGAGKKLIIDYSSPNVAKPMHVGHLRATIIGQALRNLAETQGYEVIGLNHLGDWGVQFGKLAWSYEKFKGDYDFKNNPFQSLYDLYVRFHKEVEEHPEYEAEGAKAFKALEDGDEELLKLWKMFIDISMEQYKKTWGRLGVEHDLVRGESFYSDRLEAVVKSLKDKNLLVQSEGAWVVELDEKRPPCLITKSDGASLYATRDLASALYRMEDLGCDLNLYVVGNEQKLHFSQVFSVLEKMGYEWAKNCHHIGFGLYRFKDVGKMSSRKGQVIRLNDVLNEAVEMVAKRVKEKNPLLKNKEKISEIVGVGAVVFNDLLNDRVKDVEFDWRKVTDFEGDSGPYVQYGVVRCKSILRKAEGLTPVFAKKLEHESEVALINLLLEYEHTLKLSFETFKPNYLATYLLDITKAFSAFYNNCPILSVEDQDLKSSRLKLVEVTQKFIEQGLGVLNISAPEEM
jgi:arginyl-tRNA synthetase